ncbi:MULTISPECIES: SPOR domain-containing protein [Vibrio]|uniref:SPOR domain-containing protein n=1 Tax=Vibrio TaxID=662 RepID=UPI000C165EC8|nr:MULTISPECIES: SPOR domain-containing protein [Vibrio]NAW70192.1 SPOR domain-containing protein [Vibrio sp. V28_P6S34P95]NAX05567.1 SPOR domain-containing protein [Vibrio sp. V30_P3S12P165]NAX33774.1 SPOR domain-containing protein [Vibrio sp. V29_P1S30P107]NAX38534.1 SPOR domain-containing protein [Vibrio sp. V27_P1S3P104]NAX39488.1 SPOR domain-containing protein [Vibrio sp. V26_P1S5P106]
MKNVAIVSLSVLLAACASESYITDVTTESHTEEFAVAEVPKPVVSEQGTAEGVSEQNVEMNVIKMASAEEKKVVKISPQTEAKPAVTIIAPTDKQTAMNPRYGFTIQVVAVGSQNKVDQFANQLPKRDQPIWENYKVVNGTKWYTVLYGDYASRYEAAQAIETLPAEFKALKPFVKSLDSIKNSEYPTLNKLN